MRSRITVRTAARLRRARRGHADQRVLGAAERAQFQRGDRHQLDEIAALSLLYQLDGNFGPFCGCRGGIECHVRTSFRC